MDQKIDQALDLLKTIASRTRYEDRDEFNDDV